MLIVNKHNNVGYFVSRVKITGALCPTHNLPIFVQNTNFYTIFAAISFNSAKVVIKNKRKVIIFGEGKKKYLYSISSILH